MNASSPIGIFDSGMGGISVLKTIHELLPNEDILFYGDSKFNPYGTKTREQITSRCMEICDYFIAHDVKCIVIACNTATSACVDVLRKTYDLPIIGMEPALKVACTRGNHQHIAVWATDFTLSEPKFYNLMKKFEDDHIIYKVPCPTLVRLVEDNQLENKNKIEKALKEYISLSNVTSLNSIVLGCTHFTYYRTFLKNILPDSVELIDGNKGTALHLKDILEKNNAINPQQKGSILWDNSLEDKIDLERILYDWILKNDD